VALEPPARRRERPQAGLVSALVLAADRDPFDLRLMQELCEGAGHRVVTAATGPAVLEQIARERPDVVVLGSDLPELPGRDVMRVLRADPGLANIAIILVVSAGLGQVAGADPTADADDYLTKPLRAQDVTRRLRMVLRMRSAEREAARARSSEPLDELTRAGSAAQLQIAVEYELTRAARYGHPLTCIVTRVDNIDLVVAGGGTDAGDAVVVQIANGLRTCLRAVDQVFRSELGELTALLPETGTEGAKIVLDRVRRESRDAWLHGLAVRPLPEVRVGIATFPAPRVGSGAELVAAARAALG